MDGLQLYSALLTAICQHIPRGLNRLNFTTPLATPLLPPVVKLPRLNVSRLFPALELLDFFMLNLSANQIVT